VICSATSEPHLKAIIGEIDARLRKEHGIRAQAIDGLPSSHWIVADFRDVMVHIFQDDKRAYYGLEDLWSDVPRLKLAV
jgi:ribosome-associated protein